MRFTFAALNQKKRIRLLIAVLLLAVLLAIIIGSAVKNRETPAFLTLEEISPSPDTPFGAACTEMISEYQAVLSVTEDIWTLNAAEYAAQYPRVNHIYAGFYHMQLFDTLFAAYHDIDGNGTDELFVGIGDRFGPTEVGVYAFDGETLVPLSLTDMDNSYQILSDGTFIQSDGKGELTAVKRIAADGCTLEDTTFPGLALGTPLSDVDLSAYGDHLTLDTWAKVPLSSNDFPLN